MWMAGFLESNLTLFDYYFRVYMRNGSLMICDSSSALNPLCFSVFVSLFLSLSLLVGVVLIGSRETGCPMVDGRDSPCFAAACQGADSVPSGVHVVSHAHFLFSSLSSFCSSMSFSTDTLTIALPMCVAGGGRTSQLLRLHRRLLREPSMGQRLRVLLRLYVSHINFRPGRNTHPVPVCVLVGCPFVDRYSSPCADYDCVLVEGAPSSMFCHSFNHSAVSQAGRQLRTV
jgi:hypothetical protein